MPGAVKSPMTNKRLRSRDLVPNLSLRRLIQDHVAKQPLAKQPTQSNKRARKSPKATAPRKKVSRGLAPAAASRSNASSLASIAESPRRSTRTSVSTN